MSKATALTIVDTFAGLTEYTPELIKSDDFNANYELLLATIEQLTALKDSVNESMKSVLRDQYMKTGEGKISTGKYTYSYIPATVRETIDSKKLKAEDPELYKKYVKVSSVKESFKASKKEEKKEE